MERIEFAFQESSHVISPNIPKEKIKLKKNSWKKLIVLGYWLGDQTDGVKRAAKELNIHIQTAWRYLREVRKKYKF